MKILIPQVILLAVMLINSACTSTPTRRKVKETDAAQLTKTEAEFRAKKVSEVHYDLFFDISEKKKDYKGTSKISFKLTNNKSDLRIDFYKGNVNQLTVNNKKVSANYNKHYLLIAKENLLAGKNTINIDFTMDFSRDGSGYYRFVDPEDKRIYTYTDLEPFDANRVFPCFDQPNLKASYSMKVHAPKNWHVVTSVLPSATKEHKKFKAWTFPKSAIFSTYIWSLHAGPYHIFTDKKAKYPSRIFVRQSLKDYVRVNDWHTFTRQSFEFLNEYFGYEYPYKKYDQLIVPDFNAGAMENVAAVTFSERYVRKGVKPESQRRRHANVIFHEMAHMWFGDLVTMNWWNDLWLNESFATYIANLGLSRNSEFKKVAPRDFRGTKEWALWEDQQVTTHPIEAVVPDTTQAFANFDGITYGKGASSLKQIHYYLGENGFKTGLQTYFKRHAHTNTELKDFMQALSDGSKKDLKKWQKLWLQTTGVNTIATKYTCKDNKINRFEVIQKDLSGKGNIRPHALEIAFLDKSYNVKDVLKVSTDQKSIMVAKAIGLACPTMVFSNYNDHDYVMIQLDKKTLYELEKNIDKVSDNFLKQLFWSTLWQMVYYGEYDYKKFATILTEKLLKTENDDIILDKIIPKLYRRTSILSYLTNDKSLSLKEKDNIIKNFEMAIWKRLRKAKSKTEAQKIFFKTYLYTAQTPTALNNLQDLLDGKITLKSFKIDQDKRWSLINKLSSFNYKNIEKRIEKELLKDKSSLGKKMRLASLASIPNAKTKKEWIKEYLNKKSSYSFSELKAVINSLYPRNQQNLRNNYTSFYQDMTWINANKDLSAAEKFTTLAKRDCSQKTITELGHFLDNNNKLKVNVKKELLIIKQENIRCKKVIELAN